MTKISENNSMIAEQKAQELLNIIGAVGMAPTPLDKVVDFFGYDVVAFDPSTANTKNIAGAVSRQDKRIYVNNNDSSARQRFTIAHEIGHIFVEGEQEHVDYRRTDSTNETELMMDAFAAALLMPMDIFKEKWQFFNKNIISLSDYFYVSLNAVRVRAKTLGLIGNAF
jgi:Zn-dependent peptidase ImmA (M78 family)